MGSSAASATCLRAVMRLSELKVVGVVTQPDRPAGRGKALTPCPCKAFAIEHGIADVISPENVNEPEPMAKIAAWKPDVVAVVAYGQFLKKPLLDLPRLGCVNCHFSLLPKYRGASPVAAAIAAGDKKTGVTVMKMGVGMDDGPMMLQSYEPIYSDTTGGGLMDGLAVMGGVTLAKALDMMERGVLPQPVPQCEEDATFAGKLKKSDGLINWSDPVIVIERRVRAFNPWPGCFTFLPPRLRKKGNTGRIVVAESRIVSRMEPGWREAAPGTVLKIVGYVPRKQVMKPDGTIASIADGRGGFIVKCGDTALMITAVKPEGCSLMSGESFLGGRPLAVGDVLLNE